MISTKKLKSKDPLPNSSQGLSEHVGTRMGTCLTGEGRIVVMDTQGPLCNRSFIWGDEF